MMAVTTWRCCGQATMATRSRLRQDGHKDKVEDRVDHNDYNEEAGLSQDEQEEGDINGHNEHQDKTSPGAMSSTGSRQ